MVAAYLDNWLIWAKSPEECKEATQKVIDFLIHLGFLINYNKSRLTPEQKFKWLGQEWELKTYKLVFSAEKCRKKLNQSGSSDATKK